MSKIILEIDGMAGTHCVNHVRNTLLELEGIDRVSDVEVGSAVIYGEISEDEIREALEEEGFELLNMD
ncbi:MAG: heavy metal-associated domain-containing protein [Clostridium perfringens]|nr:heavy metal-associated domain-containing protein [Clostridium perfringens]